MVGCAVLNQEGKTSSSRRENQEQSLEKGEKGAQTCTHEWHGGREVITVTSWCEGPGFGSQSGWLRVFPVCSLYVHPMTELVSTRSSGFFPPSKDVQVRWNGETAPWCGNVCFCSEINWWPVLCVSLPEIGSLVRVSGSENE